MLPADKRAFEKWKSYHSSYASFATAELNEKEGDRQRRMARLEADPEAWFAYYFPKYAKATPAAFHKAATLRIVNNPRWYEVRSWARGMAKSTRTMFEVMYLAMTGKVRNVILVSYSADNANKLLLPYMINFEKNQRLISDYGVQMNLGQWTEGAFCTASGVSFTAVGAGQSPRGARNEDIRPDCILVDDIDTDEETRNERLIQQKWEWIEQALIPTVDVSANIRILFCGNIIAKDCCITRAHQKADHSDVINLIDQDGNPSWPEKVSPADVAYIQSKISYISFQKEYMNNPLTVGTVFPDLSYGRMHEMKDYQMLVCYTDPSYKDSRTNDYKATMLVGRYKSEFHVIKSFLEQTSTEQMVKWHYDIMELVGDRNCYYYMEEVFLQDILMQQFFEIGERLGKMVPLRGDQRKKPEKFSRIETLLEPLNRAGKLIFNIAEKDNAHMMRLDEQFKALQPGSRAHDDGPDAVEGAVWMLNNKLRELTPPVMARRNPQANAKRY